MPKGVTDARREKGNSNSNEVETKKRRSHDPNRCLEALPAARYFTNERFKTTVDQNAKNFLTILYSLSGTDASYRPTINTLDDFKKWIKSLTLDQDGFLIIKQTGVTGTGTIITNGTSFGKAIHVTSGGKTYTNKRGIHIFLCGTTAANSAHIIADLSDPFVKNIIPIFEYLELVSILNFDNKKKDEDIEFADTAELDGQPYLILIEAAKMINPNVKYRRPKNVAIKTKENSKAKTKCEETSYLEGMELPSYDVAEGTVQVAKRNINQPIYADGADEDNKKENDDSDFEFAEDSD
jgi:hypothetical protein